MEEMIVCSAVKGKVNNIEYVVLGSRHYDKIMRSQIVVLNQAYSIVGATFKNDEQGFYTNKERFVSRKEAMKIAIARKQIKRLVGSQHVADLSEQELYSENLY